MNYELQIIWWLYYITSNLKRTRYYTEWWCNQSLQEKEVFVNGELEQRRGRKLRVNDKIDIPELNIIITILQPSPAEIEEHLKEKEEKERVAKLVKQLNQQQKKQPTKTNKKEKAIRFPGIS